MSSNITGLIVTDNSEDNSRTVGPGGTRVTEVLLRVEWRSLEGSEVRRNRGQRVKDERWYGRRDGVSDCAMCVVQGRPGLDLSRQCGEGVGGVWWWRWLRCT